MQRRCVAGLSERQPSALVLWRGAFDEGENKADGRCDCRGAWASFDYQGLHGRWSPS